MSDTLTNATALNRHAPAYTTLGGARTYYQDAILDACQNRDEAVQRERIGVLLTEAHRRDELDALLVAAHRLNRLDVVTAAASIHAHDTLRRVLCWTLMMQETAPAPPREGETPLPEPEFAPPHHGAVFLTQTQRAGLTAPQTRCLPGAPQADAEAAHPYRPHSNAIGRDPQERRRSRRPWYLAWLVVGALLLAWRLRQGG